MSLSLGLWTFLLSYLISIPLGIAKAVREGTRFDTLTTLVVLVGYAIPGFVLGVLLIVLFAGGTFLDWFPLRGLTSDNWAELSLAGAHRRLPLAPRAAADLLRDRQLRRRHDADQEHVRRGDPQAVRAGGARQGAVGARVLYKHVFRNALIPLVTGFPAAFVGAFFAGSLLIETLFSLDGLGLLSYESLVRRDYPGGPGHALPLHADRAGGEARGRPAVRRGRSARAVRGGGEMRAAGIVTIDERRRQRAGAAAARLAVAQPAGVGALQAQPPGLRLAAGVCRDAGDCHRSPSWCPTTGRSWRAIRASGFSRSEQSAGNALRRRLPDAHRMARSAHPRAVREGRQLGAVHAQRVRAPRRSTTFRNAPDPAPPSNGTGSAPTPAGRDIVARLLYGFRISIYFGLALTFVGTVLGIVIGALQGYFGGRVDLATQRVIEIWNAVPELYLLIIIASIFAPSLLLLLGVFALFGWIALSDYVRAEFLRNRNLEFVKAARAMGLSNGQIIVRHVLPNSMTPVITFLPFRMSAAILFLTSLDFLGLGVPGLPSLGELLREGKENLDAWWISVPTFVVLVLTLLLLTFIGDALRDAFDTRKS